MLVSIITSFSWSLNVLCLFIFVHGIGDKLVSNLEPDMLYTKLFGIDNSPNNYKTLKIHIEISRKNPGIKKLLTHHLKTKNMRKNIVKKLPFIIMCVADLYKIEEIFIKVAVETG